VCQTADQPSAFDREIEKHTKNVVTQIFTSWNRMGACLRQIDALRNAA
jgi:hypothetical protein